VLDTAGLSDAQNFAILGGNLAKRPKRIELLRQFRLLSLDLERKPSVKTLTAAHKIEGGLAADVALISEELQDGPLTGVKVLQKLWNAHGIPGIMLLQRSKPEGVVNAFRDGARGIFYRTHSLKALSKCIQTVHGGQIWASNEDIEHILTALINTKPIQFNNADGMPLLTRREEDVVRLVSDGLKNREIAQRLKVKEHSVRNYL
jgi:DNA-binding NarL/FixJ family response regulator